MKRDRIGFTMVEVLVAMFILSVITAGLFALTSSTLRFTGLTRAISTSVEDIADAEGYLSDTLRTAKAVYTSASVDIVGSGTYNCVDTNGGRCIAALTPVLGSGADEPIENFDLSMFAVIPIGTLYAAEGLDRGWQGVDTLVLVEYRVSNICAGVCSTPPSPAAWVGTPLPVGVLLGGLSDEDAAANDVAFFSVPATGEYTVQVSIVARANAQARQPFVIKETPVALQVAIRDGDGVVPNAP